MMPVMLKPCCASVMEEEEFRCGDLNLHVPIIQQRKTELEVEA